MPAKPRKRKCRYCAGLKEDCSTLRQYAANLRAEIARLRAARQEDEGHAKGAMQALMVERDEAIRALAEAERDLAQYVKSFETYRATTDARIAELSRKPRRSLGEIVRGWREQ